MEPVPDIAGRDLETAEKFLDDVARGVLADENPFEDNGYLECGIENPDYCESCT